MAQNVDTRWHGRGEARGEARREDWLQTGVLSGFIATFAMTVVLAIAYGAANAIGDESGGRFGRWTWALTQNPITERTRDGILAAIAANLIMGLVWALVYGRFVEPALTGPGWRKGVLFALVPWLLSVVAFLPLVGGGFLGASIGAGPLPILGNLILHAVYGAVLGSVYGTALAAGLDDTDAERANAGGAERGMAIGIAVGLVLGLVGGWLLGPQLDQNASRGAIVLAGALIGGASGMMAGSFLGMGGTKHPV